MKIAIVGCGAMGSVYAGMLGRRDNDVAVIDPWAQHIQAIARDGLRVEGASGDHVVRLRAFTQAPDEKMDLVIIATKAAHAAESAIQARGLLKDSTVVLTIQNGLGSADAIADVIGSGQLAVGIASAFGASLVHPGHAHHNGMAAVHMGAYAGLDPHKVEAVAAVWRDAGFTADAVPDVARMQWEKLICNVAYSAPCALSGLNIGQVMADPEMSAVSQAAATEAWEVARARKIAIAVSDPVAYVREFGARIPNAQPSLQQDYELKRPSEIDVINGAIPREAAKCGRTAPVNATLTALVKQRESRYS